MATQRRQNLTSAARLAVLLLLAVAAQASGTGRELTASHASYKQLYDEFDKHVLSDGHVCADTPASLNATVLSTSKQAAVESCRLHCKQNAQCSSWLWCEDDKGCLDGTGATLVKHTCQLRQESRKPWGVPEQGQILVQPSTFASGYVKRRLPNQQTFRRQVGAPTTQVLMATSAPPQSECEGPEAADLAQLMLMSRQNYARWHSYELHVSTAQSPHGHEFSRAALLHKLLRETPSSEVEWILYMDPQTLFDQPTYVFNFEFYAGRDLVLSCNIWEVKSGDTVCETGVMLVRNSERSKMLFEKLDGMSSDPAWKADGSDKLGQALGKLIQEDSGALQQRIHKEGDTCMNCDWARIDLLRSSKTKVTKEWGEANKDWNLFIANWFGCDLCHGWHGDHDACATGVRAHYQHQYCSLQRLGKALDEEAAEGVPLQKLASLNEFPGFSLQKWLDARPEPNKVIQSKRASSNHECYERCMEQAGCSFWVWCSQVGGCDEGGVFEGQYAYQSCTLMQLPQHSDPYTWSRGPEASSFSSGWVTGAGMGYRHEDPKQHIAVLSGIPTNPCALPWGDWYVSMAMQNHQDWTRLHGYELHIMAAATDVRIRPGPWQKIAMIRQALDQIPRERAEWLCWIDMDIILGDPTFTFPLDKVNYTDRDIIIWGGKKQILAGDAEYGLNTGVMLVRNTDWSRSLLDQTAHFGQFPPNMTTEQVLKDALPTYDIGMLEQMSMVYVLMQQPDMIQRMYFEHGYCFNCWYRNMDDPRIDHPAFTVHFAGCKMCAGLHVNKLGLCDTIFLRSYVEAFQTLLAAAKDKSL